MKDSSDGLSLVVRSYLRATLWVVLATVTGYGVGELLRTESPAASLSVWLQVLGSSILLIATLGRVGWPIRTWGGQSPAEKLDNGIFRVLYIGGTFLLVTGIVVGR